TITTTAEQEFEVSKEVNAEDVHSLTTLGVQKAYEEFNQGNDTRIKFYCVGHTPIRYYMNGYPIGNLEGHKAQTIGVDLIATFLPDDVVDGLYKAVEQAGLKVINLTLEPIAAMQIAIPEKYRLLNMALVDVGAGTSDISITKGGAITAYGMIPVAGDSLTELLVEHCLVDFDTAESIKRQSVTRKEIEYVDIMGLTQTIPATEVHALLHDAIVHMTKLVADCIKELNGDKPVSAVFVVGGGGIIPGYTDSLAKELGIAAERVAIRGEQVMQMITFEQENARKDSLMVTPIVICLSYYEQGNQFIFVMFDETRLKMYDNGALSIADAAVQAQFPNENLFPRRGEALTFLVNGKSRMVRGQLGEAAVISLNGEPADIHSKIQNGDHIRVVSSTLGEPATMMLGKLPELSQPLSVEVNGIKIDLPRIAKVGGVVRNEFYQIQSCDEIVISNSYSVKEVLRFMDTSIPQEATLRVNDSPANLKTKVYDNFTILWDVTGDLLTAEYMDNLNQEEDDDWILPEGLESERESDQETDYESEQVPNRKSSTERSKESKLEHSKESKLERSKESPPEVKEDVTIGVMVNNQPVTLYGKPSYVFVDVFEVYPFDLQAGKGKTLETRLNGEIAKYLQELQNGDTIEIYWG
ncbi:MAG: rod shape-determining protein, partial [Clostridium sp.]|nr:rod shape-determining protein [Clostridium sp.]